MGASVTTLDSSNLPSYLDLTEKRDWLTTILSVNLATYDRVMSDDQVATINAILSDNRVVVKSFVNYNDLIPRPTPRTTNTSITESNPVNETAPPVVDALPAGSIEDSK